MQNCIKLLALFFFLSYFHLEASQASGGSEIAIGNKNVQIKISPDLKASVYVVKNGKPKLLVKKSLLNFFKEGTDSKLINNFKLSSVKKNQKVNDAKFSDCIMSELNFIPADSSAGITLTFYFPEKYPDAVLCFTSIKNNSAVDLHLRKIVSSNFLLDAKDFGADSSYKFWSFQGGSFPERFDWILPLSKTYSRENFQGMNAPDYGGGMPVVDFWTKGQGIAFASLSMQPELISLPVRVLENGYVSFQIQDSNGHTLKPGQTFDALPYAIILHKGDYYNAISVYSKLMQLQGLKYAKAPQDAFEPEWCAWGYERDFNKEQILQSLDKVKSLGFKWVTIDDGWQNADGDWEIDKRKFPGGEDDFKDLLKKIHSYGLKVRLWWVPFETHDSAYNVVHYTERMNEYGMKFQGHIALEHPDWFLLNSDQSRVQVSYWNSYLVCPAFVEVREHFKKFITRAMTEWGIDGFKVDGQNFNAVPPCYNPLHHHSDPLDAPRAVALFFKDVYETAVAINPDVTIQLCPCGDNFALYNLPYVNQTVGSDPTSSFQVRTKGKTFKALFGSATSYSGDHVELTNRRWDEKTQKFAPYTIEDFASTIGIGGVPASKFTLSTVAQKDSTLMLTPEKEEYWRKWLGIYENEKPSHGEYQNLYDVAFDKPETHALRKGEIMYYSFFDDGKFSGNVELRGLSKGNYTIIDLQSNKLIAKVKSGNPVISINFEKNLMLKAVKVN